MCTQIRSRECLLECMSIKVHPMAFLIFLRKNFCLLCKPNYKNILINIDIIISIAVTGGVEINSRVW